MDLVDESYKVSKPKAVVFDWDNTLVDTWDLIHESLNYVLSKYGMETWSLSETKIRIHKSLKDTLPQYFPDNWQEIADIYRGYYSEHLDTTKPLPKAKDTLDILMEHNIPICVVTNKRNWLMHKELNLLKWNKYFKSIVGSGDVKLDKPEIFGVEKVLRDISKIPGEDIWFVGDSVTDMETAHNSGCVPVFFGEDDYNDDRFKHCRPKIYFKTHHEMSVYLQKLLNNDA
jgi:phosphoglycolate phosphatase